MGIKIWERYFLREFSKVFFLLLASFYFIYVLIDYSTHSHHFSQAGFSFPKIALYYLHHFSKRADFLLPLAILLATIRTLCTLNTSNELVALLASGISYQRLLVPFLTVSLACSALLYVNFEFIAPRSLHFLQESEDALFSKENKNSQSGELKHFNLSDNSSVIYQWYDSSKKEFFDVYWIKDWDNIYYIKYLYPYSEKPIGRFVDHLTRSGDQQLTRSASYDTRVMKEMSFNLSSLFSEITPPKHRAISKLWTSLSSTKLFYTDKEAQIVAALYYKLVSPLLCILVVLAVSSSCMQVTRYLPTFFICCIAIFGFLAFYTLLDASYILAENQVFPPLIIMLAPVSLAMIITGTRTLRIR